MLGMELLKDTTEIMLSINIILALRLAYKVKKGLEK